MNKTNFQNLKPAILKSITTCPENGFQKEETMQEDAGSFFARIDKSKRALTKNVIPPQQNDRKLQALSRRLLF